MPAARAAISLSEVGPKVGMRTVLIVDDNVDSAEVMGELISLLGYRVFTAIDANSALSLALICRPHVILLDIGLPDMDGYTLARLLRDRPEFASTHLIAHTGFAAPQDRAKTAAAGFDWHLVKPANLQSLQRALAS